MTLLNWLLVFVPVAIVAQWLHAPAVVLFAFAALGIIPLSSELGNATEQLAGHTGPTIGGLLNATLGNLAELIIGAFALHAGLVPLVKSSITGSILGNVLLVLGAAQFAGGIRYPVQKFNPQVAGVSVSLLVISLVGLVVPAIFQATHPDPRHVATVRMSYYVSGLLVVGYVLSVLFSLQRRRAVFGAGGAVAGGESAPEWSLRKAVVVLVLCAAAVAYLSEILVGVTEPTAAAVGLSQQFVGLVVVPIIGNAAEHATAVMMARRDRMDLALSIAVGSSAQVALLIAPVLVFLGLAFGQPMDLAFPLIEIGGIAVAVAVASAAVRDAESNWLEGAFLLLAYAVLGVAFFFF